MRGELPGTRLDSHVRFHGRPRTAATVYLDFLPPAFLCSLLAGRTGFQWRSESPSARPSWPTCSSAISVSGPRHSSAVELRPRPRAQSFGLSLDFSAFSGLDLPSCDCLPFCCFAGFSALFSFLGLSASCSFSARAGTAPEPWNSPGLEVAATDGL